MFKKVVSIALAALMMTGTAAIAANAAEADVDAVVAADDSSAVGADSSDTAGADSSDTAGADSSDATGASPSANTIWFHVNPDVFKNYTGFNCYMYMIGKDATDIRDKNNGKLNSWGSRACAMTDAGDGYFYFDLDDKGVALDSSRAYACIFAATVSGSWGAQTCDLLFDTPCFGKEHAADCDGSQVENSSDSNKKSYVVHWAGVDNSLYAPPLQITSIGNVIGEAVPKGETKYSLFVTFLSTTDEHSLQNAIKFNNKTVQQTIDDVGKAFGLGQDDIEKAVNEANPKLKEAGFPELDWKKSSSTAEKGSTDQGGSGSDTKTTTKNNTGGTTTTGGSSSSSGSSSVSSGQETTIFFVFGGVMLAAAGVIFLARKRRED